MTKVIKKLSGGGKSKYEGPVVGTGSAGGPRGGSRVPENRRIGALGEGERSTVRNGWEVDHTAQQAVQSVWFSSEWDEKSLRVLNRQ